MANSEDNTTVSSKKPILQVMICTYGREGMERIASTSHPVVDGVEYLVSCQIDSEIEKHFTPKALDRPDFKVFFTFTKGLAVNRNIALSRASAPLLLISDDDTDYSQKGLQNVILSFKDHPESDIITFCYTSAYSRKIYPKNQINLDKPPKGYFVSSIEIAFRRGSVQKKIWFNENFGVGEVFPSGEEDIFLQDCLDAGLKGIYLPIIIARHDGATTSERNLMLASRPQTKGAVFLRLHPKQWPLRMIAHALREIPLWRKNLTPSPISYCINWLKGVRMARKMKVFPTPDHSPRYACHEQSE